MRRGHDGSDLVVTLLRSTRLLPLCASALLGVLVVAGPIALRVRLDVLDATLVLHLAMVTLLSGAAFVLDDPARSLTEVLPIPARAVALFRAGIGLVVVSAGWLVILWLAPHTTTSEVPYPRAGLVVEAYALVVWVWAVAAHVAGTRGDGVGGQVAAPFGLGLACLLAVLPSGLAFFVTPGAPEYAESRARWFVLLATGLAALAAALAGRGRLRSRRRRR